MEVLERYMYRVDTRPKIQLTTFLLVCKIFFVSQVTNNDGIAII